MTTTAAKPMAPPRTKRAMSFAVLTKEMRTRMRGVRAPVVLGIATAVTILTGLLVVMPQWDSLSGGTISVGNSIASVGQSLFAWLIGLEILICALIAPALTAGAISTEREHQTFDLLLLTRLSNFAIVMGKLLSSLSFVAMVLICALPVMAISFLLGGVAPAELGWGLVVILATVSFFGAVGLYCSTRFPKTATAAAVAYVICLAWTALIPAGVGLLVSYFDGGVATRSSIVFATALCAFFALAPLAIVAALLGTLFRRPMPLLVNLVCWVLLTAAGAYAMLGHISTLHALANNQPYALMIGNPALAIAAVLAPDGFFMGHSGIIERYYVPISVGILLLGTWTATALTLVELRRQRQQR
jgi:ABC-2 type transport system permease protein